MRIVASSRKSALRKMATVLAVAGAGVVSTANAADLAELIKNGPAEVGPVTYNGITLYGVIDVAAQYESHGVPLNGKMYTSFGIIAPTNRGAPQWLIAPSQEVQSFVGLKIEKYVGYGFQFLGKAEIGFNPTSGELANALGAMQMNNGVPLAQQTANADGSRAGQIFNGEVYAGLSNQQTGTLRVGRLNTYSLDMIVGYDPLVSYGFSLVGTAGSLAGAGSADGARIDQSAKYDYSFGPFHVGGLYGSPGTNVKNIWQLDAGFEHNGFSFDAMGGHISNGLNVTSLPGAAFLGSPFLGARVFDTDMFGLFAKYKLDLGGVAPVEPGVFRPSVTFSASYSRIDYSNPADGGVAVGHSTIGGYELGPQFSTTGSSTSGIVNYAFTGGDRILTVTFAGVKYQYNPKWTFAAAYYRFDQNSYGFGVSDLPFYNGTGYSKAKCSSSSFTNCSGAQQVASFRVDYLWTKNLNFYGGIAFSKVDGGLAFGYQVKDMFSPTVGVKYAF